MYNININKKEQINRTPVIDFTALDTGTNSLPEKVPLPYLPEVIYKGN